MTLKRIPLWSLAILPFFALTVRAEDSKTEETAPPQPVTKTAKTRKPAYTLKAPPQFVLLAFDGSLNLQFWKDSANFADTIYTTINDAGDKRKLKFTYFINAPYFIEKGSREVYKTPGLGRPVSCIGWSDPTNSSGDRVKLTNEAFRRGHEIASHANSHCDASGTDPENPLYGKRWTEANWSEEFRQFNDMLFRFIPTNSPSKFIFPKESIVGFRAPLLATTDGLWPTLKKFNFRYDTSKSSSPTYWPQKMPWGGWNFPLAEIKIEGTTRKTFSMDYNWFVYHSAGVTKRGMAEGDATYNKFKNQMLNSYKYYFKQNYYGGRGPIHIGHHFSKWNKGVYWEVMKEFAQFVCSKPDVRCVTYKEYADWLDGLRPDIYQAYRTGQFAPVDKTGANQIKDIASPVFGEIRLDMSDTGFEAVIGENDRDKADDAGWSPSLEIDFKPYNQTSISKQDLIRLVGVGKTVHVRASLNDANGNALDWQTYRIDYIGTAKEKISSRPIEEKAMQGEGIDAHTIPE